MDLTKKKELAARTLNVGKDRIIFNTQRLNEVEEAITKQDIKDLFNTKAIIIKEIGGRRKNIKRKLRRRSGSVKKKPRSRKREYIIITRKLRNYLSHLKRKGMIPIESYYSLRKDIRTRTIKSLAQMKEKIGVARK